MKLQSVYLLENGTFPMGIGYGDTVKPNGKTIDAWAHASFPKGLYKGKTPTMNKESLDGYLMRSKGYLVKVHLYAPG